MEEEEDDDDEEEEDSTVQSRCKILTHVSGYDTD